MYRNTPHVEGETYHVYNRGAHKIRIFTSDSDFNRFLLLMYLANTSERIVLRDILNKYKGRSLVKIFLEEKPNNKLVDIIAYTLMPNHFHLVLRQKTEGGISLFMKKLMTAYSMYYNIKYDHGGVLFQGRYKSKHIESDEYFRYIFSYIHLNPVALIEKIGRRVGSLTNPVYVNF